MWKVVDAGVAPVPILLAPGDYKGMQLVTTLVEFGEQHVVLSTARVEPRFSEPVHDQGSPPKDRFFTANSWPRIGTREFELWVCEVDRLPPGPERILVDWAVLEPWQDLVSLTAEPGRRQKSLAKKSKEAKLKKAKGSKKAKKAKKSKKKR